MHHFVISCIGSLENTGSQLCRFSSNDSFHYTLFSQCTLISSAKSFKYWEIVKGPMTDTSFLKFFCLKAPTLSVFSLKQQAYRENANLISKSE